MQQPPFRNPLGTPFIELQSVDSTNNYAREQIHAGLASHGTAVFSHEQTAGKGQRGRIWTTEKCRNIIISIVVNPEPLLLSQQFQLSAAMALGIRDFFAKYAGEKTCIKWPNDLYWQDRKAGGMLVESGLSAGAKAKAEVGSQESGAGSLPAGRQVGNWELGDGNRETENASWNWAIIGVGININQVSFSPHLPNPVSLRQITGNDYKIVPLAKELCGYMDKNLNSLVSDGFDEIYRRYNEHLYKRNETVRLKKDNRVFEAVVKCVGPTGNLVVSHAIEEEFGFGEIEWIP